MQLHIDPLLAMGEAGIPPQLLEEQAKHIEPFLKQFKARGQGFTDLPRSKAMLLAVKHMARRFEGQYDDVVVLGIGGSALGIRCLRDALLGQYWNMSKVQTRGECPRLFVLDNIDLVDSIEQVVDLDRTLFVVITKSGRTPETMAQYFYFRQKVSARQFVFITDPEKGSLRAIGKEEGIPMLDIPPNVGGRFSVLSPVGLFPAALLGVDIEGLLEGAADMLKAFESSELDTNLPFQLATIQYLLEWKHGVVMTVMMPYASRLATLADWYKQLLAESIGKDGKGLTPVKALGATDQHSQLQLFNEGPKDKLILMLEVEDEASPRIPVVKQEGLEYLSGVPFLKLMNTEKRATEQALSEYKKPNMSIRIARIDPFELGRLFMLFEASIAFLGEYYRIDAFNQPGVELGKTLTKDFLS